MSKIIALIPARSGSKRVKNKNIKVLGKHPLIAYTIQSAIESNVFDEIIVSTDSVEIKEISEYYGARVPFLRPAEFSQDTSPDIQWVRHALDYMIQQNLEYDFFSILRPTSPFRKPDTIKRALDLFMTNNCDSLRAVEKCLQHPCKMWTKDGKFIKPFIELSDLGPLSQPLHSSQYPSLPEVYVQNASLEIAHTRVVYKDSNISGAKVIPFITENDEGIDVNVEEDWALAKIMINNKKAELPKIIIQPFN
ncbi:MAG: acylneuraminate cytidylyltransferase [Dehalococcoidia bacterium]|nr:acylneuraminate cytidylyltransferase [Dehalococcoidia bacterium]|tara:strand:+ start:248 stop:997 length:750 start_codon:yes stop_codon:yes gene_type:complete